MSSGDLLIWQNSGDLLIWQNFEFWSTNICFLFFLTEEINLLLVQQKTLTNQTLFFSVLNWFWGAESKQQQIFVLQNLKFCQISKSQDDIHTTLNSPISEHFRLCWSIAVWLIDFSLLFYRRFYIATTVNFRSKHVRLQEEFHCSQNFST